MAASLHTYIIYKLRKLRITEEKKYAEQKLYNVYVISNNATYVNAKKTHVELHDTHKPHIHTTERNERANKLSIILHAWGSRYRRLYADMSVWYGMIRIDLRNNFHAKHTTAKRPGTCVREKKREKRVWYYIYIT